MTKYTYFIDASTTNTGITLVSENEVICTSVNFSKMYPKFSTKEKSQLFVEKVHIIRNILDEFTKQYPPAETIYIEGCFVQPKFLNSSEVLLKFHGFLIGYFFEYKIVYYPPMVIKKTITGNGNAKKELVASKLAEKYDIKFKDNDQSDSLAIYEHWRITEGQKEKPILVKRWPE